MSPAPVFRNDARAAPVIVQRVMACAPSWRWCPHGRQAPELLDEVFFFRHPVWYRPGFHSASGSRAEEDHRKARPERCCLGATLDPVDVGPSQDPRSVGIADDNTILVSFD